MKMPDRLQINQLLNLVAEVLVTTPLVLKQYQSSCYVDKQIIAEMRKLMNALEFPEAEIRKRTNEIEAKRKAEARGGSAS